MSSATYGTDPDVSVDVTIGQPRFNFTVECAGGDAKVDLSFDGSTDEGRLASGSPLESVEWEKKGGRKVWFRKVAGTDPIVVRVQVDG